MPHGLRDSPRAPEGEIGDSVQAPSLTTTVESSGPLGVVPDLAPPPRKRPQPILIAGIAAALSLTAAVVVGITHRGDEEPAPPAAPAAPAKQAAAAAPQVEPSAPAPAAPTPAPAEAEATAGKVKIASTPIADLVVDDQLLGTTPFDGELPLGRHSVRLSAEGHQPWEGAIEVRADGNLPVQVQLVPATAPGKPGRPSKRGRSKPGATPAPGGSAPAAGPFMPDKGKGDDVFLPTGKKD
jgi:hypothetical protein